RRVSATGPALRGRLPRPDGGVADGWETADGAPVYRLQKLSAPDPGRSAVVFPPPPPKLFPPRGAPAPFLEWPRQNPPPGSCPPPCAAGGPPCPWRCPGPLPGRPGPAAGRRGG